MPEPLHLMLTPSPETSLEKAMQYIKGGFSFRLRSKLDVWQRSYDSRRIIQSGDFSERIRYIHDNPVRARVANTPELYPFCSANKAHDRPRPSSPSMTDL